MEGYEKLGYMALNVSDVGRSRDFYEKQVGLQLSGEAEGIAFLRCSEDHHSISLHGGGQPGLKRAGFEMRSAALDQLGANLAAEGITVVEVPAAERKLLGLGHAFRIIEPHTGATYEFYDHMRQWGGQPFKPTVASHTELKCGSLGYGSTRSSTPSSTGTTKNPSLIDEPNPPTRSFVSQTLLPKDPADFMLRTLDSRD